MCVCFKLASIIVLISWKRRVVASMTRKNIKLFMKFINNFNTIKIRDCYEDASKTLIKCFHNKIVFFLILVTQQFLYVRMIDVVDDASINNISNNKIFFVMFSRNKCKLIRRRYDNVDLILNNWKFIMYDLREQIY